MIFDTDEETFEQVVIEASHRRPVMVDFWADWCPPCIALTPVLEKIAAEPDAEVDLAKVEADENMHLAGRYQLRGFPTVILFVEGAEVARFSSFRNREWVEDFLQQHLA